MPEEVAVLVNSCDKYADVWPVFFTLFWKYWPDCPYQIYLGTNTEMYADDRVQVIRVGADQGWADTTMKMLALIPTSYVLWFLDDFLIWDRISTPAVEGAFTIAKQLEASYLRLIPTPQPDYPVPGHAGIGQIRPGAVYRCALEVAFWHRETLMNLLLPGETPWQMEKLGSRRSDCLPDFYSTRYPLVKRTNGLERGKWIRDNLPGLKREGIKIPPGHSVMSFSEHISYLLRAWIFRIGLPIKAKVTKILNMSWE